MKQSNTARYAYLAGMVDSDGCIAVRRFKQGSGYQYDCTILINQTDGRALDYLKGTFGGSIYAPDSQKSGPSKRTVYRWEVRGALAAEIAKRMRPFLRIKADQADLLVRFRSIVEHQISRKPTPFSPLYDYEVELREECYQAMRQIKLGSVPSAAVTTKRDDSSGAMRSDSLTPLE